MRLAFLCDFDGTISPSDIGAELVRRFTTAPAVVHALVARWRAGEIGSREVTDGECRTLDLDQAEALAFARTFALDPGFAPFVREVTARGGAVMVVSEGFDFYVRDQLERAGLAGVPWAANRSRFEDRRLVPEFPADGSPGCGRCGNCKGEHVRAYRARGFRVVLVGDGLSDRCGAREADLVLARGELLEWCRSEGIPARPFEGFHDVAAFARTLDGEGAAATAPAKG